MEEHDRRDRIRVDKVRVRTGVRRSLSSREDTTVLVFGHVERMDSVILIKQMMNADVNGRNVRGNRGKDG